MRNQAFCSRCGAPLDAQGVCMRCDGQRNRVQPPAPKRSNTALWIIVAVLAAAVAALVILLLRGRGGEAAARPGKAVAEIDAAVYYDPVVQEYDSVIRRLAAGEDWSVIRSELKPDSVLRSCDYLEYAESLDYAYYDVDQNGVDELLIGEWNDYYAEIEIIDILCVDGDAVRHLLPAFTRETLIYAPGDPGAVFSVSSDGEIWFTPSRPLNIDVFGYWKGVVQPDGSLLISEMVVAVYTVNEDAPYNYYHWYNDDPAMSAEDLFEQYFLDEGKEPEMIYGTPQDMHELARMILGVTDPIEPEWTAIG